MYAALTRYFNRISSVKLVKLGPVGAEGLLFHGARLYVEVPLTTTFFQAKGGPYSKVQTLILGENTNKLSQSKLQFLLNSFSGLQRIEVEWERPTSGNMLRSEHPVIQALSSVNVRSKKVFAVGDLPCGDLQELVLKYTIFPIVFPEDGEPHEDAKYYRSDGKISRGDGLGLYALEGDHRLGRCPADQSFAAGSSYCGKFTRALQSGDFRHL